MPAMTGPVQESRPCVTLNMCIIPYSKSIIMVYPCLIIPPGCVCSLILYVCWSGFFPSCITAMSPVLIFCNLGSRDYGYWNLLEETANNTEPTALLLIQEHISKKTPLSSFRDKQKVAIWRSSFQSHKEHQIFADPSRTRKHSGKISLFLSLSRALFTYTYNI